MTRAEHREMAEIYLTKANESLGSIHRKEGDVPAYYATEIAAGQAWAQAATAHAILATEIMKP